MNYKDMSIEELTNENIRLANQKDALRAELRSLDRESETFVERSGEISGQIGAIRAELLNLKAVLNLKIAEQNVNPGQVIKANVAKANGKVE